MCWNDGQKEFLEYVSLARQCQLKETSLTAVQSRIEQIANQNPPSLEEWEVHSDQSNTKKKKKRKTKKIITVPAVSLPEEPKVQHNEKKPVQDGFKVVTKGAVMSTRTGSFNTTMSQLSMQLGESSSEEEPENHLDVAAMVDEDVSGWME